MMDTTKRNMLFLLWFGVMILVILRFLSYPSPDGTHEPDPDGYISYASYIQEHHSLWDQHRRLPGWPFLLAISDNVFHEGLFTSFIYLTTFILIIFIIANCYALRTIFPSITLAFLPLLFAFNNLFAFYAKQPLPDFTFAVLLASLAFLIYQLRNRITITIIILFTCNVVALMLLRPNTLIFTFSFIFSLFLLERKNQNFRKRFLIPLLVIPLVLQFCIQQQTFASGSSQFMQKHFASKIMMLENCNSVLFKMITPLTNQKIISNIENIKREKLNVINFNSIRMNQKETMDLWDYWNHDGELKIKDAVDNHLYKLIGCPYNFVEHTVFDIKYSLHFFLRNSYLVSGTLSESGAVVYHSGNEAIDELWRKFGIVISEKTYETYGRWGSVLYELGKLIVFFFLFIIGHNRLKLHKLYLMFLLALPVAYVLTSASAIFTSRYFLLYTLLISFVQFTGILSVIQMVYDKTKQLKFAKFKP